MFFSEETLDICIMVPGEAPCFWTAGQRTDPSTESEFIWRTGSQELAMTYTNWYPGEPTYDNQNAACMHLWGLNGYTWNDLTCTETFCAICEIDM